jgi:hypothetical protein
MFRMTLIFAMLFTLSHKAFPQEFSRLDADKLFSADDDGGKLTKTKDIDIGGDKLRVCTPAARVPSIPGPGNTQIRTAIKIWGELVEGPNAGKMVNLEKYKWQRGQKFRLHVSSAFHTTMAVFQVYEENRPPAVQVSPLKSIPETFSTIPPGKDYALPFLFETDDDLVDETIQFVFARGESTRCPLQSLSGNGGTVVKDIDGVDEIVSKGFAKLREEQADDSDSKLRVIPPTSPTPISNAPSDVSIIMVGDGAVHLGQVILHKD